MNHLRYVVRRLLRSPGFTTAALLTLAVGIGANTAVFSVVNTVLLKPLPYTDPDRLAGLWHTAQVANISELNMAPSLYFTYREQGRAFESLALYNGGTVSVTRSGAPEEVRSLETTHEFFHVLGVNPSQGRFFSDRDDVEGNPKTAILSWGYWQSHFGGASIAGRHMTLDGDDYAVIGVLPRDFRFMDPQPALVTALQFSRNKVVLGNFSYSGTARLKPGVTFAQANADVARLIPLSESAFPPPPGFSRQMIEDAHIGPNVRPFRQDVVGDVGNTLWVVMGTIAAVLLIACANVANLLLVRAEGRRNELAIRAALGAGQGAIARELLYESLALGLAGGVLGLAFAYAALRLLILLAPAGLPRMGEIGIDAGALLFTFAVSLIAGLLFGILPVFRYSGVRAGTGLREGSRSVSGGREHHRARNTLVVVQVALALLLLIGSGLMIRTFQALRHVEPGFVRPADVLTLRLYIPPAEAKERDRVIQMEHEILTKLAAIPGVDSAAMASSMTMDGSNSNDVLSVEDHPLADAKIPPVRRYKSIGPGFFSTVGRAFRAGRDLTWNDIAGFRSVALVSENFAREYWGTPEGAIGKRIREGSKDDWSEIIGVVADERDDGVQEKAPTIVYWPFAMNNFGGDQQTVRRSMVYTVRSRRAGSVALLDEVRKVVWSIAPDSPLANVRTLDEIYGRSMARTSFTLVMLGIASAMALLLGLVGIYGVVSYSVTQRRREIGIRVALGARERQVSGMFLRHALVLAAIGVACGLFAAVWLKRGIESLLFGVSAADPYTYAAVSVALIAAAMLASYIPARRAAAVNPIEMLRSE